MTAIMSQAKLDAFAIRSDKTHYKLLNHYQVKFLTTSYGSFDPGSLIVPPNKNQVEIGNTKDPARLYDIGGPIDALGLWWENYPTGGIFPGVHGINNEVQANTGTETMLCNEGQPDAMAMAAFSNLAGAATSFHIWSSITFYSNLPLYVDAISPSTGASLTRAPKPVEFYQGRINTQIYPTYWIYVNGVHRGTQAQNPNPALLLLNTDKCQ